jgi:hypothetical protein
VRNNFLAIRSKGPASPFREQLLETAIFDAFPMGAVFN